MAGPRQWIADPADHAIRQRHRTAEWERRPVDANPWHQPGRRHQDQRRRLWDSGAHRWLERVWRLCGNVFAERGVCPDGSRPRCGYDVHHQTSMEDEPAHEWRHSSWRRRWARLLADAADATLLRRWHRAAGC